MLERSDRQLIGFSCSNKNPLGDQLSEGVNIVSFSCIFIICRNIIGYCYLVAHIAVTYNISANPYKQRAYEI